MSAQATERQWRWRSGSQSILPRLLVDAEVAHQLHACSSVVCGRLAEHVLVRQRRRFPVRGARSGWSMVDAAHGRVTWQWSAASDCGTIVVGCVPVHCGSN